jgi:dihydrofolate reductase
VISLVVAHAANRVIGRDGTLPWRLPTDMKRFRELTSGHTVVMGRKTFQSLPDAYRPLPNRRNLVLTSDPALHIDTDPESAGVAFFADLPSALEACGKECFVIGGERTYREALPLATRVYATEIEGAIEGDVFFPELAPSEWRCVQQEEPLLENGHTFTFRVYERTTTEPPL